MHAAGAPADWRLSDSSRERSRRDALAGRHGDDLWVFAYGSLIWDPAFRFREARTASLQGYRRRFCLKSELGRGTPERPGLMAGLDRGGACAGLVFRIARDVLDDETRILWRREMLLHAYTPAFLRIETPAGVVEALAFVIDRTAPSYMPGLSMDETARYLSTAVGLLGSNLEYIENLVEHLAAVGIADRALSDLCALSRELASTR